MSDTDNTDNTGDTGDTGDTLSKKDSLFYVKTGIGLLVIIILFIFIIVIISLLIGKQDIINKITMKNLEVKENLDVNGFIRGRINIIKQSENNNFLPRYNLDKRESGSIIIFDSPQNANIYLPDLDNNYIGCNFTFIQRIPSSDIGPDKEFKIFSGETLKYVGFISLTSSKFTGRQGMGITTAESDPGLIRFKQPLTDGGNSIPANKDCMGSPGNNVTTVFIGEEKWLVRGYGSTGEDSLGTDIFAWPE